MVRALLEQLIAGPGLPVSGDVIQVTDTPPYWPQGCARPRPRRPCSARRQR